jgi:Ca2+-binding RTX toxin-like protein
MAIPSGRSVGATGNPLVDGLLQGNSWTFQAGPRVITYSLNSTGYGGSWSTEMAAAVDASFAAWEAVANVDFQQVSSGTFAWQSSADIAVGLTGDRQMSQWGTIGYAFFPTSAGNDFNRADLGSLLGQSFNAANYAHPEGDIFLDNYDVSYDYLDPGGFGISVILHEIGHALGLKHPHDSGGAGFPTFAQLGISDLDLDQYTVMSYDVAFPNYYDGNPETPMVLDILAIQHIYGANMTYHTGDDVYQFVGGRVYAIWDAGGNDAIDASQSNGVTLKLEAGTTNIDHDSYSTVGIAFGVTIENAIGSAFKDEIWGNAAANRLWGGGDSDKLQGGDGDDAIYGGAQSPGMSDGGDLLDGGAGADTLAGGDGGDDLYGGDGDDAIYGGTQSSGMSDGEDLLDGGAGADTLVGGDGDDSLYGGDGNDAIYGGAQSPGAQAGGNLLDGGAGVDTLVGGAGNDTYVIDDVGDQIVEQAGNGIDTIRTSFQTYALSDIFENLEFSNNSGAVGIGNDLDNKITGGGGGDTLDGGKGNDTYWGSEGGDTYYVDSVGDQIWNELTYYGGIDQAIISNSTSFFGLSGVEIYTLVGSADITAYGNDLGNTIYGNSGANIILGRSGNDTIYFGNKDIVEGDQDIDSFIFVADPTGMPESAKIWDFQYLETLSWSTLVPLEGATSPVLWPIGLGNGDTTQLNQLEYSSDGIHSYLSFGLDDVDGADFTITLQNVVKVEDLQVTAFNDTITVKNLDVPNKAPTDISLSAPSMMISEDTAVGTIIGTLSVTDPDQATGHVFSLHDAFGNFSLVDGNKLVLAKALDADTVVQYVGATVFVTDAEGASYNESLQFQIVGVNDNAPVITSSGGGTSVALSRTENDVFATTITAADADKGTSLAYSIIGGADKALFTIDGNGVLSLVKVPDFEAPADADHNNVYEVTVQASDGKFTDSQHLAITILDQPGVTLKGTAGNDYYHDAYATEDGDEIFGFGGNDTLMGKGGNDLLDGGTGADALYGGNGDDTYIIDNALDQDLGEHATDGYDTVKASISWRLGAGIEALYLTGSAANGKGNEVANILYGNAAANNLDGSSGADTMVGGNGSDTYVVDHVGDVIVEAGATGGTDLVQTDLSYVLGDYLENLTLGGGVFHPSINGTGNAVNNTILGNGGDNRLDGLGGADILTGGKGNDTYVVDSAGDVVNETIAAGGGIDLVESGVTFSLATRTNVENLMLTGSAANATGNALANLLVGNAFANILDGGTGMDTMRGAGGNDHYLVDNAGDVVEELGSDSGDEVKSAVVRFSAIAGIEHYSYSGATAWAFVATAADNKVSGGGGADKLDGANGNDTLLGNTGNDLLLGGAGDDWLDGGLGSDTMKGGTGKDTYVVNSVGDKVDEGGNADVGDLVRSSITVNLTTLGAGSIEDATLVGATAINATGNTATNRLVGNDGANILDGKGGADFLEGGKGADTYVVDSLGDQVIESLAGAAGGVDLVKSSVTYTLGANFEKLTLTEAGNIDGFGNTLNNTLLGNIGANRLDGGTGNDTMTGGKGSDTYVVDTAGDVVSETIAVGGGIDTVESSVAFTLATRVNVENLKLTGVGNVNGTGNALANLIEGNAGNNRMDGGSGNDVLLGQGGNDTILGGLGNDTIVGGVGADQLTGGSGRDVFDFDTLLDAGDTITGFVKGVAGDVLDLRDLLDSFAGSTLSFEQGSGNTIVKFDADGLGAGGPTTLVTLLNVGLTADDTNNILV